MSISRTHGRKIIIFGAGQMGQQFACKTEFSVDFFMDNDENKWGSRILGKTVLSPQVLTDLRDSWLIVITSRYYSEIASQLRGLGYTEGEHFINGYETNEWVGFTVRELLKRYINQDPEVIEKYDLETLYEKVQKEYIPFSRKALIRRTCILQKSLDVLKRLPLPVGGSIQGFTYLLHGSQADGTYTAFSDIDDIVILNIEFFTSFSVFVESIAWLHRLNRAYQEYDITQHHGHWIFTYDELYNLNEAIIPACVFEESISVLGDVYIEYSVRESSPFAQALVNTCDQIDFKLRDIYANNINLYSLKHFVSSIALLMPLYYQSKGQFMTKSQAIHTAREQLDKEIVEILNWSSMIRSNWHQVPTYKEVERFKKRCAAIPNRIEIERYVSTHAPLIQANALGIEGDIFKNKTYEILRYFRNSVKV